MTREVPAPALHQRAPEPVQIEMGFRRKRLVAAGHALVARKGNAWFRKERLVSARRRPGSARNASVAAGNAGSRRERLGAARHAVEVAIGD